MLKFLGTKSVFKFTLVASKLQHGLPMKRAGLFTIFLMLSGLSFAQQGDMQLAEALYQAGNYEKAAELYEKLYQREPSSLFYVERLRECWSELRQYDKLIPFLQKEIARQTALYAIVPLQVHLAQCYKDKQDHAKANETLSKLASLPETVSDYSLIIRELRLYKFYEAILDLVQRARRKFAQESLFADEAADAYVFLGHYRAATEEYLKLLREDFPNYAKVQSQVMSYASKSSPAVLKETLAVLEQARSKFPATSLARQLLSQLLTQLYIEAENYDGAFNEALYRDNVAHARGGQLYSFATQMLQRKQFAVARKAFQAIVAANADVSFVQRAKIGLASVLEREAELLTGAARRAKLEEASAAYQEYERTYPLSLNLPDVYLAWANLEYAGLDNLSAAAQIAKKLLERFYESQPARSAEVLLAKIQLSQGHFSGLEHTLQKCATHPNASPEVRAEAAYLLAFVQFLEGNYAGSLQTLAQIDTQRDAANDALELRLLLLEALADTAKNPHALDALREYSAAKRALAQKKYDEAASRFADWLNKYPTSPLVDNALYERATILLTIAPAAAAEGYEKLLQLYPKSFYADKALFRLGELYESERKEPARAMACYERLLREYPHSFYLRPARERLRKLKSSS